MIYTTTFSEPLEKVQAMPSLKIWLSFFMLLFCAGFGFAQSEYVTVWQSDNAGTTDNTKVLIPANGTFDYSWEEQGNPSNSGFGSGTDEVIIEFGAPGTYVVKITPTGTTQFHRIWHSYDSDSFDFAANDRKKLLEIQQWGSTQWTSFEEAYYGCENLIITATDIPDLTNVTSMSYAFRQTGISTVPNMNNWNVSNVTDMEYMMASSFNQDIGNWNVSNVTTMTGMFFNSSEFNQNIGGWDVSNVINMKHMFMAASAFNQNIGSWNVSSVSDMSNMFSSASSFNQDIGAWDVGAVTDMSSMFATAVSFNQAIGNWDVSNVTTMDYMFHVAQAFNQNIGDWNVSNVTDMSMMFNDASLFNQNISGWDVSSVTDMFGTFWLAYQFNQNIGGWHLNSLTSALIMLFDSGLDCINYSKVLHGWASNPNTPHNIVLGNVNPLEYSPDVTPYRNQLVNEMGWEITGDSEGSCVVGVAGLELTEIKIYPNPTQDFINITGLQGKESISLYDIHGRCLQSLKVSGSESQLDLSSYAGGIYLLKIFSDNMTKTQKIIKQ